MKLRPTNKTGKYTRFFHITSSLVLLLGLLFAGQSFGGTAKEIDASTDAALDRFHKNVKDAKEVVRQSKGMLIMPNVKKGALIVGGEYG